MTKKSTHPLPSRPGHSRASRSALSVGGDTQVAGLLATGGRLLRQAAYTEAEALFHEVLQRETGNPEALYGLAQISLRQGNLIQALERMRAALALGFATVGMLVDYAYMLGQAGRLEEAEVFARKALAMQPENPRIKNVLGVFLAMRGDHEAALGLFREAVQGAPEDVDLLNNLGAACANLGHQGEARQAYQRLLEVQPAHAGAKRALEQLG